MVAYSSILPPNSLGELIRPIADISASEFETLNSAVTGSRSFSLKKDEIERLRNQLPQAAAKNLTFLLTALSFIFSHISRLTEAGMPYGEAINDTVDELNGDANWGEKKAQVIERFTILFRPEIHQRLRKIQRLQTGFLPNALGFGSFVDVRPDFGDTPEVTRVQGYLPIVQFRITTDSSVPDEKTFVFQLDESMLSDLKKTIERAESKILVLKEKSTIGTQILKGEA